MFAGASEAPAARVIRVRVSARDPDLRHVDVEGAGTFRLAAATVRALGLAEGLAVDAALVSRISSAAGRQQARSIALRLLQRRLRSRVELERALRRRGVAREAVLAVIGELAADGWIDDGRFARMWIDDRLALRPCGRRRLRAELRARGVAASVAEDAIQSLLSGDAESELAMEQARGRLGHFRGVPEVVARRRLAGWLQRRGFAPDVVARTLRALHLAPTGDRDADPAA